MKKTVITKKDLIKLLRTGSEQTRIQFAKGLEAKDGMTYYSRAVRGKSQHERCNLARILELIPDEYLEDRRLD